MNFNRGIIGYQLKQTLLQDQQVPAKHARRFSSAGTPTFKSDDWKITVIMSEDNSRTRTLLNINLTHFLISLSCFHSKYARIIISALTLKITINQYVCMLVYICIYKMKCEMIYI